MVDQAALEREEPCPIGLQPREGSARGGEAQGATFENDAGGDAGGSGRGLDDGLDLGAVAGIQRRPALADREVEPQRQLVRHAHLVAAHQEQGADNQRQGGPRPGVSRNLDGNRQQNLAGVAVVHQVLETLAFGRRPDDVPGDHTGRQGPVQGGRAAGITRIAPIGMPARLYRLADGDDGGGAGRGPLAHRDQFRLDPHRALGAGLGDGGRAADRRRLGQRRRCRQQQRKEEGEKTQHRLQP